MIVKELFKEMELLLSDIGFTGIRNVQPITVQKLEDFKKWMSELNMTEGVQQIDKFILSLTGYKNNQVSIEEVVSDLCSLEFYCNTVFGNLE